MKKLAQPTRSFFTLKISWLVATCFLFWYWKSGGPVKKTTLYIKNENFRKQQVGYNFWRYIRVEKKCFSLPAMSHDSRNILDCGLKNINFFLAEGENKWFAVEWNQQPGFTINLSFIVIGSFGIRVLRWQNQAVSIKIFGYGYSVEVVICDFEKFG